jgi:hypothetical protein
MRTPAGANDTGRAAGPEVLRYLFAPDHPGGIGHNLPQEAPEAFANAITEVDAS